MNEDQVRQRMRSSLRNCGIFLRGLRYLNPRPFPYLCVHGLDRTSASAYTRKVVELAIKEGFPSGDFGLAVGSLVPIRNHSYLIFDIIQGVREGLRSRNKSFLEHTPIHVFGVSGSLVPYLYAVGVESFDSSAYGQAAANLRYVKSFPFAQENFLTIEAIDCDCWYCERIKTGGLREAQALLIDRPYRVHKFGSNGVMKSEVYALIAMHNWRTLSNGLGELQGLEGDDLGRQMVRLSLDTQLGRRLLAGAVRARPEWDRLVPDGVTLPGSDGRPLRYPQLQPRLTPDDFDVNRYDFIPRAHELLLLACSATKPYHESRSHKFVYNGLVSAGVPVGKLDIVSISGLYGPVPRQYESSPSVLHYDFKLTRNHPNQVSLVTQRTRRFLLRHSRRYDPIIAYMASPIYRSVVSKAAEQAKVLVRTLPAHGTRKAYYSSKSLEKLVDALS
ncbi:MAG: hypothetical protein AUI36_30305 [Cyanobacteria bacterium 13_1_40CM_2_61_4]|nr:MAG: hypothetical protein AUI36_30305 [Cyanobacteria bacterium 13_1_40CM_2_61_4]